MATNPTSASHAGTAAAPEPHTRLTRGEVLAIFAFWIFMAVLTAANRLLDPRRPPGIQPTFPSAPVALAFAESLVWAVVTVVIFLLGRRFFSARERRGTQVAALVVTGLAVSIVVDLVLDLARFALLGGIPQRHNFLADPFRAITHLWFLREMIVYSGIVAAGLARDYSLRYRARQDEATHLQAETAQLRAQLAEARLSALRSQIDPHFLFNTLNAVSALVERDPRGVRRMIARLSELLRHSLEGAAEAEVTLRKEVEFVERYLEIMRIRFQGSLEVETEVEAEVMDALVPNLILQPLVENAVKHGVSRMKEGGLIRIHAFRDDGRVVLSVRDNGPGLSQATPREGVGVRNTRQRLEQLYGDAQALHLRPAEGGGVEAEVTLPFHTAGDLRAAGVGVGG
ncbi:sensor histidine kinase [Longimicrobium sp.]|uniref:sensor histidine kinase n=1 Tax=Longimicrobium sp. TaxID=2029185 RepID=UPI002C46F6B5|nr:histidine kinase [Longimicrobium sp.]HSU14404.1 histidine kinase [Longimicrobium sp.]